MLYVKSPLNSWLLSCLILILFGSCEMDSQLSTLANVTEQGLTEQEDSRNHNDSAQFRTGNIIHEETLEGSNPFPTQLVSHQLPGSHSFRVVTSPVLEGQKSARFELRKGDRVVTNTGIRSEMSFRPQLLEPLNYEGWYSFAVYLPSDGFTPDDDDETISQWTPGSGSPYLSLRVRNDRFNFRIDKEYIDLGRVVKDVWHQYVFHIKQSTGSSGLVEVWQNGEKVVSRTGKNANSSIHYFWKIGIYKPTWERNHTNTTKRVAYFDNIKIANRNASYEEMIPSRDKLSDPSKNPTGPVELNRGLVGHWKMDEGSGNRLVDHSGRNNHAQIVDPSGVSWVSGKVGRAIRMSTNSSSGRYFSTVPHNSSLNITDAITISAWIKPTTRANQTIVSKIPNGYELMTFEDGTIEFRLNRESDGSTYRLRSKKRYPTDGKTWMHVTATFDGKSSVLYINGEADFSAGYGSAKIRTNTKPVTIGARNTIFRWEGDLDDIRIYNRALSAAEAKSLVTGESNSGSNSSGSQPSSPSTSTPAPAPSTPQDIGNGLVGFWKMDERGGNTLIDNSGNRNNATILDPSGVSWVTGKEGSAIRMASPSSSGRYFSRIPHNSSLNITQAITIAAWIKPTSTGNMMIAAKAPHGYELGTFENGKMEFRINRETDGSRYRLRSNKSYPSNGSTWMHVAATFDGSKSTIYINGVADNSATYGKTQIRSNTNPLVIGAKVTGYRWEGDLDNVMIYNRALSASEIANLAR